jgi:hypothetical protein
VQIQIMVQCSKRSRVMQVQGRSEVRPLDGSERQVVMSDWSEVQEIEARARRARAEWLHGALSGLVRHVRGVPT